MSFPTVPDRYMQEIEKPSVPEKVAQTTMKVTRTSKRFVTGLTDALAFLTISFWYFFFTGLALLLGRKLPRKWLQIGVDLDAGRIARKISEKKEQVEKAAESPKAKYKVVDMQTKQPIGLKVQPMKPVKS